MSYNFSCGSDKIEDITFLISFIHIVERHPCLWNCKLKEYSKSEVTSSAWKIIAAELKDTERNCRERWKNIRCAFVRSMRPPKPGWDKKPKKPYYLASHLSFLLPYLKGNNIITKESDAEQHDPQVIDENGELNVWSDTADDHLPNDEFSPFIGKPSLRKKPKFESLYMETSDDADGTFTEWVDMKKSPPKETEKEDADLLFFQSLLPDLKKLDNRRKRELKSNIMTLLNEMLDESEQAA